MARIYVSPFMRKLAERSPFADRALRRLETGIMDWLWRLTQSRGVENASLWGSRFGGFVGPRLRKNKHVLRNLEVIFPHETPDQIRARAKNVWRQIGRVLAEFPHIETLAKEASSRFEFVNHVPHGKLHETKPGFVMLAMHQANWNLHGMAGLLGGFDLDLIYREQHDAILEARIANHRNRLPAGFINVRDMPRKMIDSLKQGRHVGLFVDHRIDNGEPIPFFGKPANTTIISARVAAKLGTGIIPVRLERLPNCHFRLTLYEPIYADPDIKDNRQAAITMMTKLHSHFEEWILAKPEEWCCVKRRWEKAPSKAEQIGLFGRKAEWRGVERT